MTTLFNAIPCDWEIMIDGSGFGVQTPPKGSGWHLFSVLVSDMGTVKYPIVLVWARERCHAIAEQS